MNRRRFLAALSLAAALVTGGRAAAQSNPLITVNESGAGSLQFPGGGTFLTPGVLLPDPGPGGLPLALTYNLLGPPGLVAGDVILTKPDGVSVSDVIRFNPAGTGGVPGYPASLVFYSDADGSGVLADTGFPTAQYTNLVMRPDDGSLYTPTANQPGFVPGFSVTYEFVSEVNAVPEPATMTMLGIGAVTIGAYRWRRRSA